MAEQQTLAQQIRINTLEQYKGELMYNVVAPSPTFSSLRDDGDPDKTSALVLRALKSPIIFYLFLGNSYGATLNFRSASGLFGAIAETLGLDPAQKALMERRVETAKVYRRFDMTSSTEVVVIEEDNGACSAIVFGKRIITIYV